MDPRYVANGRGRPPAFRAFGAGEEDGKDALAKHLDRVYKKPDKREAQPTVNPNPPPSDFKWPKELDVPAWKAAMKGNRTMAEQKQNADTLQGGGSPFKSS
jgi:hypothetical protein